MLQNCRYWKLLKIHESGANVVDLFDRGNKNSSVAYLAGFRCLSDDLHYVVDFVVVDRDFDHDFGQKGQVVLDSTVHGLVSALPAMTPDFRYCHAGNNWGKLLDDLRKLFLADNALDQLHDPRIAQNRKGAQS